MTYILLWLICGVAAFYLLKNYVESNLRSLPSPPENIAQAMRNAAKRDSSIEEIYNASDNVICSLFWTILLVESLLIWPVNLVILAWWQLFDKQDFQTFRFLEGCDMEQDIKSVEMLLDAMGKGFITLESGQGKYKICVEFRNSDDVWGVYEPLIKMIATKENKK